jgi:hypothetical protein
MEPYFVIATCCPCADGDVGARAGVPALRSSQVPEVFELEPELELV